MTGWKPIPRQADTPMSDPAPPRFPNHDALTEYLEAERPQLLAYIEKHLGPVLRKQTQPEDIYQEVRQSALDAPEQFDLPGRDPFKHLCHLSEQRILDAHRRFVAAHKRKSQSRTE